MDHAFIRARHCESIHSFANTKRDEQSGCSLGRSFRKLWLFGTVSHRKRQLRLMGIFPIVKRYSELGEQYGVDGIMIGRGIFKNPCAFERTQNAYATRITGLVRLNWIYKTNMQIGASFHRWAASLLQSYVKGFQVP